MSNRVKDLVRLTIEPVSVKDAFRLAHVWSYRMTDRYEKLREIVEKYQYVRGRCIACGKRKDHEHKPDCDIGFWLKHWDEQDRGGE